MKRAMHSLALTRASVRPSVRACVAKRFGELVHVSHRREREVMIHLPIPRRDGTERDGTDGTGRDVEVR